MNKKLFLFVFLNNVWLISWSMETKQTIKMMYAQCLEKCECFVDPSQVRECDRPHQVDKQQRKYLVCSHKCYSAFRQKLREIDHQP